MYNSNKNKYLVYIMAESEINNFKTAINEVYKHLKNSDIDFKDNPDKPLKESDIIKILIDKLNEKSHDADVHSDVVASVETPTNNKIAISITKYNYGYYLNTIENKEYELFFMLYIYILNYSKTKDRSRFNVKAIIKYFKKIYKIYKKNFIHKNENENLILYLCFYYIYNELNISKFKYNYINFNSVKKYIKLQEPTISFNKTDNDYYNLSCKILITFSEFIHINNTNNKFIISYKNYYMLYIISFIFAFSNLELNLEKIYSNLYISTATANSYLKKANDFLTSISSNKELIYKIIKSIYEPYPAYDYLIINKDKNIIDIFKENPEIEDNYNIDNNSLELVEISKDKINFNNNTYKLIGYIDEKDNYNKISEGSEGGAAGDGGKGDKGGEDKKQNINYKLFIYEKNKDKEEKDKKEKENIIGNLKALYKNSNCDDIKLMWDNNSCYMDSLFVALFNTKHKFMDDLLFNLEIREDIIDNNTDNYKDIYYHLNIIKLNLIHLYNKISNKKIKEKEQCTIIFRESLEYCFKNIKVKTETTETTETKTINNIIIDDTNPYDFTNNPNSPIILFRLLTFIFNIDKNFYYIQPLNPIDDIKENIYGNYKNKLYLQDEINKDTIEDTIKDTIEYNLNSIILHRTGHYICLFKCNNNWYEYDDHKNTSDSEAEVSITKIKDYKQHIDNGIEIGGTKKKYIVVGLYYI
jgi:hypothetical protein